MADTTPDDGQSNQAIPSRKRKRKSTSENGPRKSRQKSIHCPICLTARSSKLVLTLLTCNCIYCIHCIREAFIVGLDSTDGVPNFPARCCGRVMDLKDLEEFLTPQIRRAYRCKTEELRSDNPLYCAAPECGAFILNDHINNGFGTCSRCKKKTCAKQQCKKLHSQHFGIHTICPEFFEEPELNSLAQERGWKRCPKCCAWTEKIRGCNQFRCICRTEWCYQCGKPSKGKIACVCYAKHSIEGPDSNRVNVQREGAIISDGEITAQHPQNSAMRDIELSIEHSDLDGSPFLLTETDITAEMDRLERQPDLWRDQASNTSPQVSNAKEVDEEDIMRELDELVSRTSRGSVNSFATAYLNKQQDNAKMHAVCSSPFEKDQTPSESFEDLFRRYEYRENLAPLPVSSATIGT